MYRKVVFFFTFYLIFLLDGPMKGFRAVENELSLWLRRLFVGTGLERVQKATTFVNENAKIMFKIIAIMFLGIAIGYLVRKQRWVSAVGTTTMITIVVLLFVMGGEIGGNKVVMSNLVGLGGEALLIAVAATLGSVVAARIIYKAFFKREGDDER